MEFFFSESILLLFVSLDEISLPCFYVCCSSVLLLMMHSGKKKCTLFGVDVKVFWEIRKVEVVAEESG